MSTALLTQYYTLDRNSADISATGVHILFFFALFIKKFAIFLSPVHLT